MTTRATRITGPLYLKFWSKVQLTDGCWLWKASRTQRGYGDMGVEGKTKKATHVMWFLRYGRWPDKWILHSCDNPPCVNPAHLSEGDAAENMRQAAERGRSFPAHRPACSKGHPYTKENTQIYQRPSGEKERVCRICKDVQLKHGGRIRKPKREFRKDLQKLENL